MEQQMKRPIILDIEDAKQELVQCVNNIMQKYQLPCYFLAPIFDELNSQIKASAQNELSMARAQVAEHNAMQISKEAE